MNKVSFLFTLIFAFFFSQCSSVKELSVQEKFKLQLQSLSENLPAIKKQLSLPKSATIINTLIDTTNNKITIEFSRELSSIPLRRENVDRIYREIKNYFVDSFINYSFLIKSMDFPIEELIPNYYRAGEDEFDSARLPKSNFVRIPVVQNISKKFKPAYGLFDKNILLWHSHGWYYNKQEKKWMWQRARLFQTVEDLGPLAFTIPYLIPMLENAGANVFVPRERDVQLNEVIVDNDFYDVQSYFEKTESTLNWETSSNKGFSLINPTIKEGENPFIQGTSRFIESELEPTANIFWNPIIPETGEYAVYISYSSSEENVSDAHYTVLHNGGRTEFLVNQKIGGGTWIYLGTFHFSINQKTEQGVLLTNQSAEVDKIVSADAVRFGGGMGIVERDGATSKRPKFAEGSRYWLQFAGMPDTLIYNLNKDVDDYKDDYQSRAEYGNYLYGAPFGPSRKRDEKGLGIPIDLSLAFHTDAGISRSDTVIGTLMIYSIYGIDSATVFPDGVSRLANRDLSDIVQTQIVEDLKIKYDSAWTRRQLMNALYSEAARPNYPSMLLELLSHQNYFDMKYELDPVYRFDVSRSIYKGMLRFLSVQFGFDYVVQPLPVTNFSVELIENDGALLKWKPQIDPLESTAKPTGYIVYTKEGDGGFNNGILVSSTELKLEKLKTGVIYSYKVTSINEGGESFPSEILSACRFENGREPLLVVNGFDRVAAPASFESSTFSGFLNLVDEGVPYKYDAGFTGTQFNFDPDSKWETDNKPGHGASGSDFECKIIAGNTFDYSYVHGRAIVENGFSFCSASDESVMDNDVELSKYKLVDFISGEEKKTPAPKYQDKINFEIFPIGLKEKISIYLNNGGNIFISGAYLGSDLCADKDSLGIIFAEDILRFKFKTDHAVKTGKVFSVSDEFRLINSEFEFNTVFNDSIYKVEAPDELGAVNGSKVLLRYSENNFSAAIGYKEKYGVVSFGFPFETVLNKKDRAELMKSVLSFLKIE